VYNFLIVVFVASTFFILGDVFGVDRVLAASTEIVNHF